MKMHFSTLILTVFMLLEAEAAIVSVGPGGPQDTVIQVAIDAASPGDRIEVGNGTYFENLIVSKKISLIGIDNPVIDAGRKGSAITIFADGVVIEGFTLINSSFNRYPQKDGGIRIMSNGNIIHNNIITDNRDDLVLFHSCENIISNNILANALEGIDMIQSHHNTIFQNFIVNNEDGMFVDNSSNNLISSNQVLNCSDDGIICINGSRSNIVEGNWANGNKWHGLELFFSDNNTIINNYASGNGVNNIFIFLSKYITISGNEANHGDQCGINVVRSKNNLISKNNVSQNKVTGISLDRTDSNTVIFNEVSRNGMVGIGAFFSYNNSIYGNNLSQNSKYPAYDDGENHWGSLDNANRYSDFDERGEGCFDKDNSGICDESYLIQGSVNVDRYPMAR